MIYYVRYKKLTHNIIYEKYYTRLLYIGSKKIKYHNIKFYHIILYETI